MLCEKCHNYQNHKPSKACDYCARMDFSEDLLCCIARSGAAHRVLIDCGAYRPKLSLVSSKRHNSILIENKDTEVQGFTDKDKWFRAYAKQQLQLNPEAVQFKLQFHVCLVTKQRKKFFSSSQNYFETITNIIQHIATGFKNTQIELLWVCADHIHLYLNTVPDYSLDEIVDKLIKNSAQEIQAIGAMVENESSDLWEAGYFAETIG